MNYNIADAYFVSAGIGKCPDVQEREQIIRSKGVRHGTEKSNQLLQAVPAHVQALRNRHRTYIQKSRRLRRKDGNVQMWGVQL